MSKVDSPSSPDRKTDTGSRKELMLLRRLEMLKKLQGKKMRTSEIAELFDVDDRTIREDVKALRKGMTLMGVRIKLDSKSQGGQEHSYRSTVHPVFLALNLTEVLTLLNLLEEAAKNPLTGSIHDRLFHTVYAQLTGYAHERLKGKLQKEYEIKDIQNLLEEDAVKESWQYHLGYLLKSGQNIPVEFTREDGLVRVVKIMDVRDHRITVQETDGTEYELDYGDVLINYGDIEYK